MATTFLKVTNRAKASLAAAITDTDTSLIVNTGAGALFPSTYPFHITIEDEILSCTNRSTDTMTVVRAQQGTTAVAHSMGKDVQLRVTAKSIDDLNTAVNTLEGQVHTQNTDTDLDATFETTFEKVANKGAVSGYASLDSTTKVPVAQLGTGTPTGALFLRDDRSWAAPSGGGLGYTLFVQALTSSPVDSQTVYFGQLPKAPIATANISKIYIRKAGTIKIAEIRCYSGTAGTGEAWSLYIRKNNSTDTLIATLSVAASERVFSNTGLSIAVVVGDYIEIKGVQPAWATNPLTTIYGGYIYIE